MDAERTRNFIDEMWNDAVVPELVEYIRIPNKSPAFDAEWAAHGYMDDAVGMMERWSRAQPLNGAEVEVVRLGRRTPLIYMDVPGEGDDCVLLYGHLDKQPEMTGWRADLGPWNPVLEGDRLYGRGGADDGYALYASITALLALQHQGLARSRCVVLIEASEESGSPDLPHYIDALSERIGRPSLVACLDSGCGNYEQLWCTTSLRGMAAGDLSVQVLTEGVHSGDASGIVPSPFRLLRHLLSRIEDESSGRIVEDAFHVNIPPERLRQAAAAAQVLGEEVYRKFPLHADVTPQSTDLTELVLSRTWRPALSITGAAGLPPIESAGNVTLPEATLRLSLRLPPICDADAATALLKRRLESDPPHGATVRFHADVAGKGWNAPPVSPWLDEALQQASRSYFGTECVYMGEGGSIPFMGMLGEKFPDAQFLVTGVLGPHSNAHGPNEFLHIPTGKKITCSLAHVLRAHYLRNESRP